MKAFIGILIALVVLALAANRQTPVIPKLQSLFGGSLGTDQPLEDCRIKGNISMSGERIYHLPGRPYYDKTRIDIGKGERWFCSEEEARAAGWRKSRAYRDY